MERTLEVNNKNLIMNLIKLGIKLGVFSNQSIGETLTIPHIPNTKFLQNYLDTIQRLALIKEHEGILRMGEEKIVFDQWELMEIIPDFLTMYDYIATMASYKAVSDVHPNVLMSFEKDGDVWDLFLENPFCNLYRQVINETLDLNNGDKVLDIGCGSVSPLYFSEKVGPNGFYRGVEKSRSLSRIANNRLRKERIDWAEVKNLDFMDVPVFQKYDYIICSDSINYLGSYKKSLRAMIQALNTNGKLIIYDTFPDTLSFDLAAYEFYNSLNRSFFGYISRQELKNTLLELGNLELIDLGKNFLVVKKC